jgi:hypothetical protein
MAAPALPEQVIHRMARRSHRYAHYLWHAMRNNWSRLSPQDRDLILKKYPGWAPPRPALDEEGKPILDNDSGEDFLYMHREMIAEVNRILEEVGDPAYQKVEGWVRTPAPDAEDYPVPDLPNFPDYQETKSDAYYHDVMTKYENRIRDRSYLRTVTLGRLGAVIEYSIHGDMHKRWAAPSPMGYRPRTPIAQDTDPRWDDPAYAFLGDTYASHVNPTFWKIHGWVDARIEEWKSANGIDKIKWKGDWTGPLEHHHRPVHLRSNVEDESSRVQALQEVATILGSVKGFDGFL